MTQTNSDNMPEVVLDYINQGHRAALATVVETWGSAPRPVGAQLAIRDDGEFQGSVSGGCVEGAVVAEALEALDAGDCRLLEYGVSDEEVFAVGLACGGTIKVLVEPVGIGQGPDVSDIEAIAQARKARRPVGIQTNLTNWHRRLIGPADAQTRFASDKSGMDGDVFTVIQNPPLRLVVVGAVHIAQALLPMARIAGYAPFLVDPRDSFASQSRFPDETILNDWPDAAVEQLGLDARTALVTLTHDPKLDTPALAAGLKSDAFYIGALGSGRTHAKRRAQLEELGFESEQIDRISGPVGLDIGAATPAEIALSVMAEMTQTLRKQ
ncbi:XdhC family protein [Neptunicoccus cionae]|uniref:XdhC family protein n=1 Tax=Neptunicoccus cionae TaxID=2035344 RepID=UPI000C781D32|nr:XdhC family protein [Amylibacter cionae]PLS20655.1 XdhC/CoxI family protein [Amylibacter cionae]